MKSTKELCRGCYLVSGVAVPHNQLSILGGTDEKPAGKHSGSVTGHIITMPTYFNYT